jgi:hypothetical protein
MKATYAKSKVLGIFFLGMLKSHCIKGYANEVNFEKRIKMKKKNPKYNALL